MLNRREAYMGSGGEVPCPGFGDEIPKMIIREASIPKNRREAEGGIPILKQIVYKPP